MKKILIVVAFLILGVVGFWFYKQHKFNQTETGDVNTGSTTADFRPDPSNATFNLDGTSITLSKGVSEVTTGSFTEETRVLNKFAYGDLNGDEKNDTALLLSQYGGGSGTFIYVAAYISGPVNYKGTDGIFIGDRIAPQSISISNGVVTLTYLDRDEDEAFAAEPTVKVTKQFVMRNGVFVEK